jgi:hypothetical protein
MEPLSSDARQHPLLPNPSVFSDMKTESHYLA